MTKLEELQSDLRKTYKVGKDWGMCTYINKMRCKMDGKLCVYDYLNSDEPVEEQPHKECFEQPEIPNTYFAALIQWANRQ